MRWGWFEKDDGGRMKDEVGNARRSVLQAGEQGSRGAEEKSEIRCPLCGKQFRAGDAMPCAACALAAKCGLVMCPNCAYEFAV